MLFIFLYLFEAITLQTNYFCVRFFYALKCWKVYRMVVHGAIKPGICSLFQGVIWIKVSKYRHILVNFIYCREWPSSFNTITREFTCLSTFFVYSKDTYLSLIKIFEVLSMIYFLFQYFPSPELITYLTVIYASLTRSTELFVFYFYFPSSAIAFYCMIRKNESVIVIKPL